MPSYAAAPVQLAGLNLNGLANELINQTVNQIKNQKPGKNQPQSAPTNSANAIEWHPTGELHILSGNGDFNSMSNKMLTVSAGTTISGGIKLQAINSGHSDAVAPLIWTPSWGDHSTSWKLINGWTPTGQSEQEAQLSFTAPATPGIYHIVFAFQWEMRGDQVASASNWSQGADKWNDGNDIAELTAAQISEAQVNGHTEDNWLIGDGYKQEYLPCDAITLVVAANSSSQPTQNILTVTTVAISMPTVYYDLTLGAQPADIKNPTPSHTIASNSDMPKPYGLLYSFSGENQPFEGCTFTISLTVTNTTDKALPPPTFTYSTTPATDVGGGTPSLSMLTPKSQNVPPHTQQMLNYVGKATWTDISMSSSSSLKPAQDALTAMGVIGDAAKTAIQQGTSLSEFAGKFSVGTAIAGDALTVAQSVKTLETTITTKRVTYLLRFGAQPSSLSYSVVDVSGQPFSYSLTICWPPPKNDVIHAYTISAIYEAGVAPVSTAASIGVGALASGATTPAGGLAAGEATGWAVEYVANVLEPYITDSPIDVQTILAVYPDYRDSWYTAAFTGSGFAPGTVQAVLQDYNCLDFPGCARSALQGKAIAASLQEPCPAEISVINNTPSTSSVSPFTSRTITQGTTPLSLGAPSVTSVSPILSKQTQTISISGNGFGTQNAFNGTSKFLKIHDDTANWDAGYNGDWIHLNVSQWTDSQILIKGFTGAYGLSEWKLNAGNKLTISVWNAQTVRGPATFNVTVSSNQ